MKLHQAIDAPSAVESAVGMQVRHRALRKDIAPFLAQASLRSIAVIPVIYSLIVPLVLLDLWITLYQRICFPVYGIAQVKRSKHLVLDRQKLAYLNAIEAFNCRYCSYGNGVLSYAREIAGLTEEYWCPIKHAIPIPDPHERYPEFVDYDDAEGYRAHIDRSRAKSSRRRPSPS